MSEPYTPTTEEIIAGMRCCPDSHGRELTEAEFDRALAAHDREVAARVLRDLGLSPRPHIGAALPGMVRGLYDTDMREKSIRNLLGVAADLITGYAAVIARADRIERGEVDV